MNIAAPAITHETDTPLKGTRFTVPGMRCAGCIAKIERELPKLDGVMAARVNFSAKRVAVEHDPSLTEGDLTEALLKLGFEAQPIEANPLGVEAQERTTLVRALGVAGFGMMNIMLLSVSIWSGAEGATRELFHWLSALIAMPVIAYSGRPFFASAWMALKYRRTNMDVPISIGVILATALSLYETITGGGHAYFESAVMLLFFLLAGRAGCRDAHPHACRDRCTAGPDGQECQRDRPRRHHHPHRRCRSGAGNAGAGRSRRSAGRRWRSRRRHQHHRQFHADGESTPESVGPRSKVHAGAINLGAPFRMRLTRTADDTALAEIARLMDEAGQSRSHYVRIADRASRAYAPAVHTLAALAFVGWMIAGAGWHQSLVIAIAVLIITCPCAMGLAVPTAQVVASGALLKRGLLVKDGSALERLAETDVALFDKTGTLTLGEPRADISGLDAEARSVALGLAQSSRHPLSRGLAESLRRAGVEAAPVEDVEEISGEGLSGTWNGLRVALERPDSQSADLATRLRIGDAVETLTFSDPLRPDAAETIAAMRSQGIEASILSGDRSEAVEAAAQTLGMQARAQVSPQAKLAALEELRSAGKRPLMVGDGLNDGPALAAAHASIAPGTASDASQQAADAVFIGDRLMPVALAIRVARRTMQIVRQNFVFAIGYNVLAVPLALFGYVTPLIAAIAMSVSSLVVVANSLRLAGSAKEPLA